MLGLVLNIICVISVMTMTLVEAPLWAISGAIMLSAYFIGVPFFLLIVLAVLLVIINLPLLRTRFLSKYLLSWAKKKLPPMSATEQEAIAAGDTWVEAKLFQGQPNWQEILDFPMLQLTVEEQDFIANKVRRFCALLNDWQITHKDLDLPAEAWEYLKKEKFFGLIIPKQYGGLEFSALANSAIVEMIASKSLTAAVTAMVPNSLGPAELLLAYGTKEQKDYYLPRLASGEEIPCFALTGIEAGSDAGSILDKGVVCKGKFNGKQVLGMKLTWNKRYITLAPIATVLGLAFKLYDPDHLLSEEVERGITLCLLPANHPGVNIGNRHFPLNQPFMNGPTSGDEVFVPLEWIIGGEASIGRGWQMLVECLAAGRGISLPAVSTAAAKLSYLSSTSYAKVRKQFNTPIGKFEGIEEVLAELGGYTYLMEATRLFSLAAIGQHIRPSVVTAIAKYHLTELARKTINHAMDIHGGKAIMLGPKNYLARFYEGIPISITVEGANILMRNLVIFGQGAIRCHPFIQTEVNALYSTAANALTIFDKTIFAHAGYFIKNIFKVVANNFLANRLIKVPNHSKLTCYLRGINKMSLQLAVASDLALIVLGGNLKRKERLSARLGDVLSHLYMATAVVKYYLANDSLEEELPFAKWSLSYSLNQAEQALVAFYDNFNYAGLGKIFKFITLPWGRRYQAPKDLLAKEVVANMNSNNKLRQRLSASCFIPTTQDDPVWQLEEAFNLLQEIEPLLKKLDNVVKSNTISVPLMAAKDNKVVTEAEIKRLEAYDALRLQIINVDAFTAAELKGK